VRESGGIITWTQERFGRIIRQRPFALFNVGVNFLVAPAIAWFLLFALSEPGFRFQPAWSVILAAGLSLTIACVMAGLGLCALAALQLIRTWAIRRSAKPPALNPDGPSESD